MKVSDLMSTKCVAVYGGDSIQKISEEMAKNNRGLVVVLNNMDDRKVVGVVSNKDIINKVISKKRDPETVFATDIMSKECVAISPDKPTIDAIMLMRKHNIKRVIVIEDELLQGIISSHDLLDEMVKYKKQLLDMAIDF